MKRPSFQFYPADWISDRKVYTMTPAQKGGYMMLLCFMWEDEACSLPNNTDELMALSGLNEKDLEKVLGCFIASGSPSDRITHKRLSEEREKQDAHRIKMSAAGRFGNEKRWKNKVESPSDRQAIARHRSSSPSSTSIYTPLPPKGGEEEEKKMEAEGQMVKWFSGMDSVSNPTALAKKYLQKHKAGVIIKALRNSSCTDLAEFGRLLEHYEKK